jgi:hypothetical protein
MKRQERFKPNNLVDPSEIEPWEVCSNRELARAILDRIRHLRGTRRHAISYYFGLAELNGMSYSQDEIAARMRRNRSAIRCLIATGIGSVQARPGSLLISHARDLGWLKENWDV